MREVREGRIYVGAKWKSEQSRRERKVRVRGSE